ncbi:MAG: hypothetical protein K0R55_4642 [Sporomusa sp.]|nr:hypothetical protein [Sporomusa sp.]
MRQISVNSSWKWIRRNYRILAYIIYEDGSRSVVMGK